ncbi:wee1-like protein kinase [Lolium rigidum]|uniref:wee1-like protein kinase n=1 Tax=Lolium rigidum TaxID=89674 RepID=UPI001F5D9674|nr:wee1-like protein kinase [Lolium rigidum]
MLSAKTPRLRGGSKGRRRFTPPATKAQAAAAAAAGISPSGELSQKLEHVTLFSYFDDDRPPAAHKPFEELLDDESHGSAPPPPPPPPPPVDADVAMEDRDCCILSQDFFCTPDYLTPPAPQLPSCFDADKENIPCPQSPEKSVARSKRYKRDCSPKDRCTSLLDSEEQDITPVQFGLCQDDSEEEQMAQPTSYKRGGYVPRSARVLRSQVTPPPCIRNPYNTDPRIDDNLFCVRQRKSSGASPSIGADGLSRYRTDFHELEQIGYGNFSVVFKVLRRIEGCLYAVKRSNKQLHNDMDRRLALKEVHTLVALGNHENIVGYFTSWFEADKLYIQMELCDRCLSLNGDKPLEVGDALDLLYQVCKGLDFIHGRGIAHLDVKPDNIYVRDGVYKLGDFGCATLIDRSLAIEEGDSRYMPPEMLSDKYEHLDKVDIFSLGATVYELIRGTPLPESGLASLREGKIALLPGHPIQFQSLIKSMLDPDPVRRPSAKEILRHSVFEKLHNVAAKK